MVDLDVILKSIDCTYKQSFVVTRDISLSYDSEDLQALIKAAQNSAKFTADSITIKVTFKA